MSENNDNFESLRQLMALKRHEAPPPGYFEDFSSQVIARLKAGEAKGSSHWSERFAVESPWIIRFLRFFEAKPAMVGSMAAALCVLLVIGLMYSDVGTSTENMPGINQPPTVAVASPVPAVQTASQMLVANSDSSGLAVSTNYSLSLQPVSSTFGGQQNPFTQPASFTPSGN